MAVEPCPGTHIVVRQDRYPCMPLRNRLSWQTAFQRSVRCKDPDFDVGRGSACVDRRRIGQRRSSPTLLANRAVASQSATRKTSPSAALSRFARESLAAKGTRDHLERSGRRDSPGSNLQRNLISIGAQCADRRPVLRSEPRSRESALRFLLLSTRFDEVTDSQLFLALMVKRSRSGYEVRVSLSCWPSRT